MKARLLPETLVQPAVMAEKEGIEKLQTDLDNLINNQELKIKNTFEEPDYTEELKQSKIAQIFDLERR